MAILPTVIEFFAPVVDVTINALLTAITQKMAQGQRKFILLISTPGGSVFHGLSAYNFLSPDFRFRRGTVPTGSIVAS